MIAHLPLLSSCIVSSLPSSSERDLGAACAAMATAMSPFTWQWATPLVNRGKISYYEMHCSTTPPHRLHTSANFFWEPKVLTLGMPLCGFISTLWSAMSNVNSVKPEQALVSIDLLKGLMAFLWGTAVWCKWKSRNVILNTNVRFKKKKTQLFLVIWALSFLFFYWWNGCRQSLILYPTQTALIS